VKNKLEQILDGLDNPLFSTINESDLEKLANRYEEKE